ncbi:MAG: F0F1 ATP synthase subunit delta [Verrucomicrobia bacterium]|nr:F0F1 ATP synthase subunit delta [Verrucomicrobiota bacterium]
MKLPKKARRDAKALFRKCLVAGAPDEGRVRIAVQQVLAKKPRGYLAILNHFQRLLRLALQRRQATVQSARALTPPLQGAIQSSLTRLYGTGLTFRFQEEPALIGGLRVQVGSDVYDGSIQSRLTALRESF